MNRKQRETLINMLSSADYKGVELHAMRFLLEVVDDLSREVADLEDRIRKLEGWEE